MYITSTVRPEALVIVSGTLAGVLGGVLHTLLCCTYTALLNREGLKCSHALAVDWSSVQAGDSGPGRFFQAGTMFASHRLAHSAAAASCAVWMCNAVQRTCGTQYC